MDAIVLFSGGLDSTVLLATALQKKQKVLALSFDYSQRHIFELQCAEKIARHYNVLWKKVTIDPTLFSGLALTNSKETPEHEQKGELPNTYVPARNTLFISYALAFAEMHGAKEIHFGVNIHDREGYPDTTPQYCKEFAELIQTVSQKEIKLLCPLIDLSKTEILNKANTLGVPVDLTSSCYDPSETGVPCLKCGACKLREEALKQI